MRKTTVIIVFTLAFILIFSQGCIPGPKVRPVDVILKVEQATNNRPSLVGKSFEIKGLACISNALGIEAGDYLALKEDCDLAGEKQEVALRKSDGSFYECDPGSAECQGFEIGTRYIVAGQWGNDAAGYHHQVISFRKM